MFEVKKKKGHIQLLPVFFASRTHSSRVRELAANSFQFRRCPHGVWGTSTLGTRPVKGLTREPLASPPVQARTRPTGAGEVGGFVSRADRAVVILRTLFLWSARSPVRWGRTVCEKGRDTVRQVLTRLGLGGTPCGWA